MKIVYDPGTDKLFIQLRNAEAIADTVIELGVSVALDGDGHIIGVEIADAAKRLGPEPLAVAFKCL